MSSSLANHSDISHITTVNNNKVSFIDITRKKSYYGISKIEDIENYTSSIKQASPRELEILSLISEGFKSSEVADYLNISKETVATHRKNILKKTNFKTFAQVVTHFVREGLI
jgi:DNA-binding CsgD family transcriptional regulator